MVSAIMKVGFCYMRAVMGNKESTLPGFVIDLLYSLLVEVSVY